MPTVHPGGERIFLPLGQLPLVTTDLYDVRARKAANETHAASRPIGDDGAADAW